VRKRTSGLSILIAAAVLGYGLIALPPAISQSYDSIYRLNPALAQAYLYAVGALAAALISYIILKTVQMWRRSRAKASPPKMPAAMTEKQIRSEIDKRRTEAAEYLSSVNGPEREELAARLAQEESKHESETLEIAAFGTISSGKSSLLNALLGQQVFVTDARGGTTVRRNESDWPGYGKLRLVDTPGLGEMHGSGRASVAVEAARSADLVLYVTDGVLRSFEFDVLKQLAALEKRMIVCLNKEDTFNRSDIDGLLAQMRTQLKGIVPTSDIVAVRASPAARIRVRITPDGEEHEEQVQVEPDVSALADRMMEIIQKEGSKLLLANLLIRARGLVTES
jgi:small GTP-binding protein